MSPFEKNIICSFTSMDDNQLLQSQELFSIGEFAISVLVVVVGVVVTIAVQKTKSHTSFIIQQMKDDMSKLDRKLELNNQVQFTIHTEEIKVLNQVYDRYLDWLHLVLVVNLKLNPEENQEAQDEINFAFNEFNKASFRLDWWFSDNEELLNIVDEMLDLGVDVRDFILLKQADILDIEENEYATYIENTTESLKKMMVDHRSKSDKLKELLSSAIDNYKIQY